MLKTTGLSEDFAINVFRAKNNEVVRSVNDDKADETAKNLSKFKKLKNENSENLTCVEVIEEPIFLILSAKKTFNCLRQAFVKAPIFWYFDSECHIQIQTDVSGYAIRGVFN